ncbi:MAG: thermonuclease family protein [Hyphomicrobiaceae bacterium]
MGQTCRKSGKPWQCGRDAQRHLARLIGNHDVTCTITKRDRFDRLLARCSVGQRDLNLSMIRDGMAVSFGGNYRREEQVAKRQKIGIWAGEFLQPRQWRRENGRS